MRCNNSFLCSYATVIPSDIIVGHIEQEAQGVVSRLYGSWLSFVEWNGSRYWDITQPAELPQRYLPIAFPPLVLDSYFMAVFLNAIDCHQTAASDVT
jgi:hypothetical protein